MKIRDGALWIFFVQNKNKRCQKKNREREREEKKKARCGNFFKVPST